MPPSRRAPGRNLFEDLGLLDEPEPTPVLTPVELLGMDPAHARALLDYDESGTALRTVLATLGSVHRRLYHPDGPAPTDGDADKLELVRKAINEVEQVGIDGLKKWARATGGRRPAQSGASPKVVEDLKAAAAGFHDRTKATLLDTFTLAEHPRHFSRLDATHGVLASRENSEVLLVPAKNGTSVLRATNFGSGSARSSEAGARLSMQAHSFGEFMDRHGWFGTKRGQEVGVYADGKVATLLDGRKDFVADITQVVEAERQEAAASENRGSLGEEIAEAWLLDKRAQLVATTRPRRKSDTPYTTFKKFQRAGSLPMHLGGSLADIDAVARARRSGWTPLEGSSARGYQRDFNLLGVSMDEFARWPEDVYSPLMAAGNRVMFFDRQSRVPVVTDIGILAVLGADKAA